MKKEDMIFENNHETEEQFPVESVMGSDVEPTTEAVTEPNMSREAEIKEASDIVKDPTVKANKMKPWGRERTRTMRATENTSQRSSNQKVFDFGNNLHQIVLFPETIHYADQEGKWQDIDNRLVLSENGKHYETMANAVKLTLAAQANDGEAVSVVNARGESLGWGYEEAAAVPLKLDQEPSPGVITDEDIRRQTLEHYESSARYEEVYPYVDIECHMRGVNFKDEMILKSHMARHAFRLAMKVVGLRLEQDDKGNIHAMDRDKSAFTVPRAFMRDANGEIGEVKSVLEVENGEYMLTLVCDEAFLAHAAYPVVIDPMIISPELSPSIEDNYVCSKQPDTVMELESSTLRVSNNTSTYDGICYSFVKHNDLPDISTANTITKAYLSLELKNSPSTDMPIGVHEVQEDWHSSTITYNNRPTVNSHVMDYVNIASGTPAYTRVEFDVSNLMRKWCFHGEKYGVMLESLKTSQIWSNVVNFYSSDAQYHMPIFTINYIANSGLFGYTEYDSQDCGRAGVGHVNLHNGNLVVSRQLTKTTGTRMPLSVTLYYNSCRCKELGYSANVGCGWKLSCDQHVEMETIGETVYYLLEDGDGTKHWFERYSSSVYYDMSGLRLKMTIASSEIRIEDPQGMVSKFYTIANGGRIKSIADPNGNTMTFTYSSGRLTQITDGAGRATQFTYYSSGMMYQITTPDGYATVTFDGGDNMLYNLFDRGEGYVDFDYDSNKLLTALKLQPEYGFVQKEIDYTYTASEPYRVVEATEKGSASAGGTVVQGAKTQYTYGDCMTTVKDLNVANGKKMIYHFNDYGNVVSVQDELGYAKYASYTDDTLPNHASEVSKLQRTVVNPLPNHDFEATSDWSYEVANGATGSNGYATDQKRMGSRSARMVKTNESGFLRWYMFQSVETGQTYTLSGYIHTSGNASCYAQVGCGGIVTRGEAVRCTDGWERVSVTFTAISSSAVIGFMTGNASGTVWLDCVQLELGGVVNRYNMIRNGDFTRVSSGKASEWTEYDSNTTADGVVTMADNLHPTFLNTNVLHLVGSAEKTAGVYQVLPITGAQGDVFVVGGWAKGFSKPIKGEERRYCLRVSFSTSSNGSWTNGANIDWNEEWTDWHFTSGAVIAPIAYNYVRVDISYQNNVNEAWFDGITLYKEEFGRSFDYDENGNVTSATTLASSKAYATYDSYNNMTSYRQPGRSSSEKHTMTWSAGSVTADKRLLMNEKSPMEVVNAYDYDSYGNEILARTRNTSRNLMMQSTKSYTSDANHVSNAYDARNLNTSYGINANSDLVNYVSYPNGQTVNYSYDTQKRMTGTTASVSGNVVKNEYVYDKDMLSQVKHNTTTSTSDVVYTFGHDALGRQTTVTVGSGATGETPQTLSTNHYNSGTETLADVTFGNGGKVAYEYDDFKRVTGVKYDTETSNRYSYDYSADGRVGRVTDNNLNRVIWNEYDLADRPARLHIMGDGGSVIYRTKLSYDAYNNLSKFEEETAEGSQRETTYTYDADNRPTQVRYGADTQKVAYTYDALGRITTRKQYNGNSSTAANTSTYSYLAGGYSVSGYTCTTPLVSGISQNGVSFSYGYATNTNNITSEVRSGGSYSGTTTYSYDTLGQLVRVNDPVENATWVFNYDRGGNMLSKARYAYTTGTPSGTPAVTYYAYDTTWKDRLISNGGYPLTYDAIGNLSTYGGWEYTWEAGRQLKRQVQNSTVVEYEYDSSGMRVRKTYKHTSGYVWATTNYTYNGKMLAHLEKNGDNMHFYYDAQGRPAMVDFNGTKYHYLHNLQGDVIGLVDTSGNLVVEYKYNAWGSILGTSTLSTAYSTLASMNPFRYRGYVYDEETWMYYCRARYYYPELQRWINADALLGQTGQIFGHNLYCYCGNDPVIYTDPTGYDVEYYPDRALAYAEKHWNNPNSSYYTNEKDCANFVSQCLYEGGLNSTDKWYHKRLHMFGVLIFNLKKISPAWGVASELYDYLKDDMNFSYVEIKTREDLKKHLGNGSILAGHPAFIANRNGVHHAILIGLVENDDAYYYAHTNPRSPFDEDTKRSFGEVIDNGEVIYAFIVK